MRRAVCLLLTAVLLAAFGCAGKAASDPTPAPIGSTPASDLLSPFPGLEPTEPPVASEALALFPDAASAEAIPDLPKYGEERIENTRILRATTVFDATENVLGYVIVLHNVRAYNPPLVLALGVRPDGTTAGIVFLELNETPGKGSLANEPAFKDQFRDRAVDSFRLRDSVDAISGATITSKAVVNAVNTGLEFFRTAINP